MNFETMQQAAEVTLNHLERFEKNGRTLVKMRDGAPEWVSDVIREAHGDMMPDDFVYQTVEEVLMAIAESRAEDRVDAEDYVMERMDEDVSVYHGERFAWLASNIARQEYVNEAVHDFGLGNHPRFNVSDAIAWGMVAERRDIALAVLDQLENMIGEWDTDLTTS